MRLMIRFLGMAVVLWPLLLQAQTPPATLPESPVAALIKQLAQPAQRDAAVKELIAAGPSAIPSLEKALGDQQAEVRASAAEALRALTKDLKQVPDYHTKEFWEARLAQLHADMPESEALTILTKNLSAEERAEGAWGAMGPIEAAAGGGQTSNMRYRLDGYWVVMLYFSNADAKRPTRLHPALPELKAETRVMWVKPPDSFSGTWTTWYVNGQRYGASNYKDGKRKAQSAGEK